MFAHNWMRLAVALEQSIPGSFVTVSEGGYFLCLDIHRLPGMDDLSFVQKLATKCGIAAIPMRLFYNNSAIPRTLVRFAICKKRETIDKAIKALGKWS